MLISWKCIFQSPAGFFRDKLTASVSGRVGFLGLMKMCDVIFGKIAWQVLLKILKSFEIMFV